MSSAITNSRIFTVLMRNIRVGEFSGIKILFEHPTSSYFYESKTLFRLLFPNFLL